MTVSDSFGLLGIWFLHKETPGLDLQLNANHPGVQFEA